MPVEDAQLLRRYVDEHSDAAFREFVAQRFDFVYAAALRQVGGDAHLARDVAQTVFIDAARKARLLVTRPSLAGWLHTSTRYAALAILRARARRSHHEQKAHLMDQILSGSSATDPEWPRLRPVLDTALAGLGAGDREAILLRFFEGRTFGDVGAVLGLGENAARMRVERALEKLRRRLARYGITSTAAALAVVLTQQPVVAAPAGLAAAVAGASLAGAAAQGVGLAGVLFTGIEFMNTVKTAAVAAGLAAALGLGAWWGTQHRAAPATASPSAAEFASLRASVTSLESQNRRLRQELGDRATAVSTAAPAGNTAATTGSPALHELHELVDLKQKKLLKPKIAFLNRAGKLDDTFVTLFALNSAEKDQMQQAVDAARAHLAELERKNATITRQPDGSIVIAVPPFPSDGGKVYDQMTREFAAVLGPERNAAYMEIGSDRVEQSLAMFGAAQHTYIFGYDASDGRHQPYTLSDTWVQKSPHGGVTSDGENTAFESFAQMAANLGPIVEALPPDFPRGK